MASCQDTSGAGLDQVVAVGRPCSDERASCSSAASSDDARQDLHVLSALASLGISEDVRNAVRQVLWQMQEATARAQEQGPSPSHIQPVQHPPPALHSPSGTNKPSESAAIKRGGKRPGRAGSNSADTQAGGANPAVKELEEKLGMCRSIMRKLYHRNLELEKELKVQQACSAPITFSVKTQDLHATAYGAGSSAAQAAHGHALFMQALQERDATVLQLRQALDAAQRRSTLLEAEVLRARSAASGPGPVPGTTSGGAPPEALLDVQAQSQLHYRRYRQVRDDYVRLLNKRTNTIQTSRSATESARAIVGEMATRLQHEVAEREAEAALYSARLFDTERKLSDRFVERKLLEEHITRLNGEIAARDRLDAEMETCVLGLLDRLKQLEATNEQLRAVAGGGGAHA